MVKVDGKMTVKTNITVDISSLIDEIVKAVYDSIENFDEYETYIEDENIVIKGSYTTPCTVKYFHQTRWEPAEYDYECDCGEFCGEEAEESVEKEILNSIKDVRLAKYVKVTADFDDDFEFVEDAYEPDPDMLPGGWDRRFD